MQTEEKQVVRYNIITVGASKLIKKHNIRYSSDETISYVPFDKSR